MKNFGEIVAELWSAVDLCGDRISDRWHALLTFYESVKGMAVGVSPSLEWALEAEIRREYKLFKKRYRIEETEETSVTTHPFPAWTIGDFSPIA